MSKKINTNKYWYKIGVLTSNIVLNEYYIQDVRSVDYGLKFAVC